MGKWVITVAGVAILSVLCDIILPEGQTRKYVKTVFGVVVTLVILQPLIGLFGEGNLFFPDDRQIAVQQQYIDNAESRQQELSISQLEQTLRANGLDVAKIELKNNVLTVNLHGKTDGNKENLVASCAKRFFPDAVLLTVWS